MPARRRPKPARLVEIGVKVPLTPTELQQLRDLAAAELFVTPLGRGRTGPHPVEPVDDVEKEVLA